MSPTMTEPRLAKAASRLALPLKKRSKSSRLSMRLMPTSMSVGAGLDHIGRDEAGAADGGDEDVGLAGDGAEVARLGVADCDGRVLVQQEHGGGLAHNVTAADDDGVLAGDGNLAALEDFNHAGGRAGRERGTAGLETAGVDGMKAVDILGRRDRVEEGLGVNLFGKRKLDQDAVDVVAGVETAR